MKKHYKIIVFALILLTGMITNAQVQLPKILGNNMVLQQGKRVPVWGTSTPGDHIAVSFNKQTKHTIANASGKWEIFLDPPKASAIPDEMKIAGSTTILLHNILVGEVWLCSGQSNMEYTMRKNSKVLKTDSAKNSPIDELKTARNSNIRIFLVTSKNLHQPDSLHLGWSIASDSALRSFSAAGYFFAKELYDKLHVPIGVISAAIPGSAIEPWLPGTIIPGNENFSGSAGMKLDASMPGKFYPTMIKPVAPFSLKGFLWYQGETNCFQNEAIEYTHKMNLLINGWRNLWQADLPFYYVQISPFFYSKSKGKYPLDEETLPRFWEAQTHAMSISHTGMIVINDLAKSPEDLHPNGKWEVGRRLAQWPLAMDYGRKVTPSGPKYKSMTVEGNAIILEFDYTGKGLVSGSGPLTWFTIAGNDNKFVPADAVIKGDRVIVSSPQVLKPANVRFAWNESAQPNFFNKDGLPAIPFRTNDSLHFKPIH
ncbi:MAG: sialate O-acetylesterase [Ferruginibacter sp.]|nr:sialate O-acetylesterase [Ferruginibacter sp.]